MKNNKGVTLVELLVVIVVMGIIAGFAIPAVGGIIENANRDAVLNDAIQVQNAAKLYCSTTQCDATEALTWTELGEYIDGIEGSYVETTSGTTDTLAYLTGGEWGVRLTRSSANYNLPEIAVADYVAAEHGTKTVLVLAAETSEAADEYWFIPSEAERSDLTE